MNQTIFSRRDALAASIAAAAAAMLPRVRGARRRLDGK